ncbi:MAG: 8-oxo-dGDP phosphatase [Pseudonocardiales bacterium]|jgi:ADP-ribose pyrophosphatase|nr:8-oxo-dGDP phosphatase [Pseudonocardiales bacterium]
MGEQDAYDIVGSEPVYKGKVITVRVDDVRMSDGAVVKREVVSHPGAVGVVALDDDGKVVLVNQYRPAIRCRLDELPAGLLDVSGEAALDAAKRELAEEARLAADEWNVLLDLHTSPGFSDEAIRIFLARGLHPASGAFEAEHEELTLTVTREPLAEAVRRALTGGMTNAAAVAGVLAAVHGRATGWRDLRPADAPWPARPRH